MTHDNEQYSDSIIIHCPTVELWNAVREKAHKEGVKWLCEIQPLIAHGMYWSAYRQDTCLRIDTVEKIATFGDIDFYQARELPIITAETYLATQ